MTAPHRPSPPVISESSGVSVKLVLGSVTAIVALAGPVVASHFSLIRSLDSLKYEVVELRGAVVRQGNALEGSLSVHDFRGWLRESQASGKLAPFRYDD